jgi:hypothetical protein
MAGYGIACSSRSRLRLAISCTHGVLSAQVSRFQNPNSRLEAAEPDKTLGIGFTSILFKIPIRDIRSAVEIRGQCICSPELDMCSGVFRFASFLCSLFTRHELTRPFRALLVAISPSRQNQHLQVPDTPQTPLAF